MIEIHEFKVSKSIGPKWKENYKLKGGGICREIASMEEDCGRHRKDTL